MQSMPALECPECGSGMEPREGPHGRYLRCPPCDISAGVRPNGKLRGQPADRPTREARVRAHRAFDRLWMGLGPQARVRAYEWLAWQLWIPPAECHIGQFDVQTCERVVTVSMNATREGVQLWEP